VPAEAAQGLEWREPPIFERGAPGRSGVSLGPSDVPEVSARETLGALARRRPAALPEVSEPEAIRHYVRLSQWNYSIDTQFYPLGSCTMKHNPKVNEWAARLEGFALAHPLMPAHLIPGALELMVSLQSMIAEIVGMDGVCLQPAAGAQGELTGLMMIRAHHRAEGRSPRKVFIPDSAHGTNPASATLNGFESIGFPAGTAGVVEPETLMRALDGAPGDVAALMITNPNTLGLYEQAMPRLAELVHARGGLVYGDGANLNAVLGRARPGDAGVDVLQLNLHKTFTTPHGGGGPGCGPVAFKRVLEPYQPVPYVRRAGESVLVDFDRPLSVGRVRSFFGNFGMMVRAYTYMRELGPEGLKAVSDLAVLNARYVAAKLEPHYPLAFSTPALHEAVFTDRDLEAKTGVKTLDLAKRLIDYGMHPPTVYFPLVVRGALMIEPTETETKQTLDGFVEAMIAIAKEARETPELVKGAPHLTRLGRLDEARAARRPRLRWTPETPTG
jgi:glycine dehydrogenase subunit 2